ncbi:MAG: hypothetical protein EHM42_13970, partial [Planctomycetaceae bacterium]
MTPPLIPVLPRIRTIHRKIDPGAPVLLSMTGFGEARHQSSAISAAVEVRAVNNRYLKVVGKFPEWMAAHESEIERSVRRAINRGTVSVAIRIDRVSQAQDYVLNAVAIKSYWSQLV